jgi:hypothetical protein
MEFHLDSIGGVLGLQAHRFRTVADVRLMGAILPVVLLAALAGAQTSKVNRAARNSWRGISPLRSSAADVARVLGVQEGLSGGDLIGPFKVDGGEVTFSYLTPSLAELYRAPRSLVGKVFTIYFKPDAAIWRAELKLELGFKRCDESLSKRYYYLVSDAGLAYQLRRDDDQVEMIIYQPSRAQVRKLSVNTECVF